MGQRPFFKTTTFGPQSNLSRCPSGKSVIEVTQISVTAPSFTRRFHRFFGTEVHNIVCVRVSCSGRNFARESMCDSPWDKVSSLRHWGRGHFDTVDQVTANDIILQIGRATSAWSRFTSAHQHDTVCVMDWRASEVCDFRAMVMVLSCGGCAHASTSTVPLRVSVRRVHSLSWRLHRTISCTVACAAWHAVTSSTQQFALSAGTVEWF